MTVLRNYEEVMAQKDLSFSLGVFICLHGLLAIYVLIISN